ncbi:flavodoxin family protein [Bacillus sp. 03113]|uniref:flavodoxin family protein n=1 Tax=Bacillus sp. 03113 TaxID=2578211 RepID=UPI001143AB3E|nr:flavodoxin family protein [Bacillus sp. 03113]
MLVIDGGTRINGNTEVLTNILLEGIPFERIYLKDYDILPIVDQRHDPNGFQPIKDDFHQIITKALDLDVVIFATPIYWYGMSGLMKNFIDRWSQGMRDVRLDFKKKMKSKKMFVVAVGGDNPRQKGLPLMMQFQYIFDFVGAHFVGYLIGEGNAPSEILNDKEAIHQAQFYHQKLQNEKIHE